MPTLRRSSGVVLTLPVSFQVEDIPPTPSPQTRRGKPGRQFGPVPLAAAAASDELVAAFARQEMAVYDQLRVVAETPPGKARRSGAGAAPPELGLEVPLAAHEDAAILLEQDGFYSWHFAADTAPTAAPNRVVCGSHAAAPTRSARFAILLAEAEDNASDDASPLRPRGVIGDFIRGKINAFIFKFAARVVVGQALKFLERRVRRGLVLVSGPDPSAWGLVGDPAALRLPTSRPARVLLLVHGTFSSSVGAYASLTATPWGREFLLAAQGTYDVVLGFDHATLSDDPLANATDLLAALQAVGWAYPPRLDVVTHSRGGLVFRSLVEQLLPLTGFQLRVERVIFVGATNAGTLLASPVNWQALMDLYTNLSVGACRLLELLPQAAPVALVLEELVRGLGAFVKYLATTAVSERVVPGLAAMDPAGKFVRRLNEQQPGQPAIAQSYYCAVTSVFQPRALVGGGYEPRELSARLLQWLGSGLMQALMREANDLVVNTASMTSIDPGVGNYLKDTLAFGPNPQIYHTNYFVRPEVIGALTRWLRLVAPAVAAGPATAGRRAPAQPVATRRPPAGQPSARPSVRRAVAPGQFVEKELPARVDTDLYVTNATTTVAEALRAIGDQQPSYVVVRDAERMSPLNEPETYAFTAEDILGLGRKSPIASLYEALNLAATAPSVQYSSGGLSQLPPSALVPGPEVPTQRAPGGRQGRRPLTTPATHTVVLVQGQPAGVLPPPAALPDGPALAALARRVTTPRKLVDFVVRRRTMPTFNEERFAIPSISPRKLAQPPLSVVAGSPGDQPRPKAQPKTPRPKVVRVPTSCHFRAEMDEQVVLGRPTAVEVLVSREHLAAAGQPATATASADVTADQRLLIQVLPKVNFAFVEPEGQYWREIEPPPPGLPASLYFTLRATHQGEGEVWVVVRQGQVPLVTLCLRPQVLSDRPARAARRVQVEAAPPVLAAPLTPAVHQLTITERRNGAQLSYFFQLQLPDLRVLQWGETQPFVGDRAQYVAQLYQEIEQRWLSNRTDTANFTAELRALGGSLFDELIPVDLQRLLWQHRDHIRSILVLAEEPFIPWELVCPHAPGKALTAQARFLGQLGLVRWLHVAGWPREQLRLRPGKRRYVIPHYPHPDYVLPEAEKEADFLRDTLGAQPVRPTAQAVRALLGRPGAFDLLHFACHGEADSANIANAQLLLEGRVEQTNYLPEYLSATTVEQYANFGAHAPLVVLNACQAGRAGYKLTGVGGFAQAFLRRGAGAFVGTLWSVGDQPARDFTETLYQQLLAGATLAEATTAAREQARQAGDATWLAYAVYGHPYAKLVLG